MTCCLERGNQDNFVTASFSPDDQRIVTASENSTARVWNAANVQLLGKVEGHTSIVRHATFSPDDRHIVTASADKQHGSIVWSLFQTSPGYAQSRIPQLRPSACEKNQSISG